MMGAFLVLATLAQAAANGGADANPGRYPFAVGERFVYGAKLGPISVGRASMAVAAVETVRSVPAFHFRFEMVGGNRLFRMNNVNESWTTVDRLMSLRFHQEQNENNRHRTRQFEIFPDSGYYRQSGVAEPQKTPAHPVDDAAIVYYLRHYLHQVRLEEGKHYRFDNYFKAEKNPLIVRIHRSETLELPDGTRVRCTVLQPMIGDDGLFSIRSDARIWITDDARRIPVQIRSRFPWGTITLRLEEMTLAPATGA